MLVPESVQQSATAGTLLLGKALFRRKNFALKTIKNPLLFQSFPFRLFGGDALPLRLGNATRDERERRNRERSKYFLKSGIHNCSVFKIRSLFAFVMKVSRARERVQLSRKSSAD